MGTGGWPGAPRATRARLGGVRPGASWAPGWPPLVFISSSIFIYSKINLREILAHLEMCRIGISDIAFSGPEFQLPVFSLLV
jgi:hypothetical protein